MGRQEGGRLETEGTYVHLWLIHVDIWQKPVQYRKATILQLKIKFKKEKKNKKNTYNTLITEVGKSICLHRSHTLKRCAKNVTNDIIFLTRLFSKIYYFLL